MEKQIEYSEINLKRDKKDKFTGNIGNIKIKPLVKGTYYFQYDMHLSTNTHFPDYMRKIIIN